MSGLMATAETDIAATPVRVWAALTAPDEIAAYMWGTRCIGLLTACLSEVGCTELHLAQESRVHYSPGPCHATALGAVRVT